jgi:hypothetical protein
MATLLVAGYRINHSGMLLLCLVSMTTFVAAQLDQWNYRGTENNNGNNDYGPKDWGKVKCNNPDTCVSWLLTRTWVSFESSRYLDHLFGV